MANVKYVQRVGDMMHLVNDDGTKILAYPSSGEVWTLASGSTPGPDPDPGGVRFSWPFPLSTVSSEYGPRGDRVHQGIDLAPGNNTPIPAAGAGKVHQAYKHQNFGNMCVLVHPAVGNSGPLYTLYAHMIAPAAVRTGQAVTRGQIIGRVGDTGASFGAHLHWETHIGSLGWNNPGPHINPRVFMQRYANA